MQPSDLPLRKVTLNLYDEDVRRLEQHIGRGWSELVRDLVHDHVRKNISRRSLSLTQLLELNRGK